MTITMGEQPRKLIDALTPRQLADELGLTVMTLKHWRSQSLGPPWWRAGRRIYYDRAAVLTWIEEQRRASAPLHTRLR